jgi:predicted nucleotidyltransferase
MKERAVGLVQVLLALDNYASKVENKPDAFRLLRGKIQEYLRLAKEGLQEDLEYELSKWAN